MTQALLTLGSRGSPLALAQARLTRKLIAGQSGLDADEAKQQIAIKTFTTSGDQLQDRTLVEAGGKGLFTKELDAALIAGQIDVSVHSMKDVPTLEPEGLEFAGMLPREDPREALIAGQINSLDDLPKNPVIGTASVRRQAQVLTLRPDAKFVLLRGNVGTRLKRLKEGRFDATFLAFAGLKRLGMAEHASAVLSTQQMLPSPAQGAIGLQIRTNDHKTAKILSAICCQKTQIELAAERSFLAALDGSCRTPIAALAQISGHDMSFCGEVYALDGTQIWREQQKLHLPEFMNFSQKLTAASQMGAKAGQRIAKLAGNAIRFAL